MIAYLLHLLVVFVTAVDLSSSIEPVTPKLSAFTRLEWSVYVIEASEDAGVDPRLIAAVIEHESDWNNLPRNATNDYGLMQVHWQAQGSQERWLDGLTEKDLLDPQTNILAGARELAHMRSFCAQRDRGATHHWVGHYKWGVVVMSEQYGNTILWRQQRLQRHRPHISS